MADKADNLDYGWHVVNTALWGDQLFLRLPAQRSALAPRKLSPALLASPHTPGWKLEEVFGRSPVLDKLRGLLLYFWSAFS